MLDENSEQPLGILEYKIAKLKESPKMKVKDDFALKDCFTNGYINMGFELKVNKEVLKQLLLSLVLFIIFTYLFFFFS